MRKLELHPESHLDHGLSETVVKYILDSYSAVLDEPVVFVETFTIPSVLADSEVPCALYGPIMGDEPVTEDQVSYEARGDRQYPSRLVSRPVRKVRTVTVIAGPHDGRACVLYTAFGGPQAPKEPGDPTLKDEEREESEKFWAEHALACEPAPVA